MQQKDVIIGHEYNIKMEGELVRVKVLSDRGYGDGHARKFRVQRVDSGKVLPKCRTCQALYPLQQSETNHG
jgi:hypothetical protein